MLSVTDEKVVTSPKIFAEAESDNVRKIEIITIRLLSSLAILILPKGPIICEFQPG